MSESGSPLKKIRRAFLQDENQGRNNHTCKCEELLKTVTELKAAVEQRENVITGQKKLLLETYAEQKVLLNKLLRQQNDSLNLHQKFPISSVEKLIALNSEISDENKHAYVKVLNSILKPCGVEKNLKYILSSKVVMDYNIDGVHGKKSLKGLENVYSVLIESIPINTKFPEPAEDQLRRAIQLQKKREIKANSVSKKQNTYGNKQLIVI